MNQIDTVISEFLSEPYKLETDNLLCWAINVVGNCYGSKAKYTIKNIRKDHITSLKIGREFSTWNAEYYELKK